MFVKAIETAGEFTRPIHWISRNYGSSIVIPGAATLFFVNTDGWALTCRHVVDLLASEKVIAEKYAAFKADLSATGRKVSEREHYRRVAQKHGYNTKTTLELKAAFPSSVAGNSLSFDWFGHPAADVALLHFLNCTSMLYPRAAVFPADTSALKQGKFLCRLGFPFPEFNNFAYDATADTINWTDTGRTETPRFPIEGMVTRHVGDTSGQAVGFEMSTPGLRGQSGGPAFDSEGKVWGMQCATSHLDLDFDVNQQVLRDGEKKLVTDSAFLHVGLCAHVDLLKDFMRQHHVAFTEA
ncbi:MAG: trypsin-like peptidase domain-containing protein [Bryobacteraceae bacterium]